jgi:hypothetical protein
MQPRRLRLGDVVDDYCSRCRLLSNHAIAAIVDDVIKQTRCSTCDFEHPYKDGKLPVRRAKKDGTSALYKQVLDNVSEAVPDEAARPPAGPAARPVLARPEPPRSQPVATPEQPALEVPVAPPPPAPALVRPAAPEPPVVRAPMAAAPRSGPVAAETAEAGRVPAENSDQQPAADEGIVHRRLIRATLPRPEGEAREPRPIPTFTVHEAANARGAGKFRRFRPHGFGQGGGNGNANGGNFNGGNANGMPRFGHGHGHGNQASPFGAGRGHGNKGR